MTRESSSEITGDSTRRRLAGKATTSEAREQTQVLIRRALLFSLGFALLLAFTSTRAGAASSRASAAISAHLTMTRFASPDAPAARLIYKFSKRSKSFRYELSHRSGTKWKTVRTVKNRGIFKGTKRTTVRKIFRRVPMEGGAYRLRLIADKGGKVVRFRIVPFSARLTKSSFKASQAGKVYVFFSFSGISKHFSFQLNAKSGSTWKTIKTSSRTKTGKNRFRGRNKTTIKSVFNGKQMAAGSYRLRLSSEKGSSQVNFKITQSADPATSTGGSGSGSGGGSGSAGGADFTISGGVSGLEPGLSLPVRLTLTNSNNTKIYVTHLAVSMSADSTPSGCSRDANFTVTQSDASSSNPITVPAKGSVTLTSAPRAPRISFLNLSTNQNVCKGKSFVLSFSGSAHS